MSKMRLPLISAIAVVLVGFSLTTAGKISTSSTSSAQTEPYMEMAVMPDQQQFTNPAFPVVAVRTVSGRDEDQAQYLIKEIIVENRSMKDVSSVKVRWVIAPLNSRTTSLRRGEFSPHVLSLMHKTLKAGQRMTLKLSHPKLLDLIHEIPNLKAMGNKFVFLIGVAEVVFDDGSVWKEPLTEVGKKSASTN